MEQQPEVSAMETSEIEPIQPTQGNPQPWKNFLLGAFFGSIPVFVALDMSSYMTHTPIADFGWVKLALAAAVPLIVGALGVALKGKFLKALSNVMESTVI